MNDTALPRSSLERTGQFPRLRRADAVFAGAIVVMVIFAAIVSPVFLH